MLDRHLIKKLAQHSNREIQIAMVTRGVTTINNFEILLREYMGINHRTNNEFMNTNERQVRWYDEHKCFQKHKGVDEQKQGWQQKFSPWPKIKSEKPVINSLEIESQASGSKGSSQPINAKQHHQWLWTRSTNSNVCKQTNRFNELGPFLKTIFTDLRN